MSGTGRKRKPTPKVAAKRVALLLVDEPATPMVPVGTDRPLGIDQQVSSDQPVQAGQRI